MKAIDDRSGRVGNVGGDPFEPHRVDAVLELSGVEADDANRQLGEARRPGLARDVDPDLSRELGTDLVEAQGRQQTENSFGNPPRADGGEGMVFSRRSVNQMVEAPGDSF